MTPIHVDARHVFLDAYEYTRIAATFFGDGSDSYRNLARQMSENSVASEQGTYINATIFLLLMLMEFKIRRVARGGESEAKDDIEDENSSITSSEKKKAESIGPGEDTTTEMMSSKNILMNGIAPRLERYG